MAEERIPKEHLEFRNIGGSPKPIDTRTGEIGGEAGREIRQRKTAEEFKNSVEKDYNGDANAAFLARTKKLSATPIKVKIADYNGKAVDAEVSFNKDARRKFVHMLTPDSELAYFAAHFEDVLAHGEYMGRRGKLEEEAGTTNAAHSSRFEAYHYWKGKVTALLPDEKNGKLTWKEETRDVIIDVGEKQKMPTHVLYTAKHSADPTFATKEAEIRKHAKKISEDSAFWDVTASHCHRVASDSETIAKRFEIVNIRFAGGKRSRSSDRAVLDHFCRRLAELGMDVFGLRKGA